MPIIYGVDGDCYTAVCEVEIAGEGGPGSGNWGHVGVPGKKGGSAPKGAKGYGGGSSGGGGKSKSGVGKVASALKSKAKSASKSSSTTKKSTTKKSSSGSGGGSKTKTATTKKKTETKATKTTKSKTTKSTSTTKKKSVDTKVKKTSFTTKSTATKKSTSASTKAKTTKSTAKKDDTKFKNSTSKNSTTTKKKTTDTKSKSTEKKKDKSKSVGYRGKEYYATQKKNVKEDAYDNASKFISEELGVSKKKSDGYLTAINSFTTNSTHIRANQQGKLKKKVIAEKSKNIEEYIKKAPNYDGKIYRGMKLSQDNIESMKNLVGKKSKIDMLGTSSWSYDKKVSDGFSKGGFNNGDKHSVIFVTQGVSKATSVGHLSAYGNSEREVMVSQKCNFRVTNVYQKKGQGPYYIELEEAV